MQDIPDEQVKDTERGLFSGAGCRYVAVCFLRQLATSLNHPSNQSIQILGKGRYPPIQLCKLPLLLPIIPRGSSDDNQNGHADGHPLDPIDLRLATGRLVHAQGERDHGRDGEQDHDLVVVCVPEETEEGLALGWRDLVLAEDADAVRKLGLGLRLWQR